MIPPIVTDVAVKFTTPEPELLAENNPVNVELNESLALVGTVWFTVSVNVPDAAIGPLPEKNVWKLPKLEPVGVFSEVEPSPVNVNISAFPEPPKKVTEFEPLPAHPAHVKTPEVLNVTGVACAFDALKTMDATNAAETS